MEELHYITEDGFEITEEEADYIENHTSRYAAYAAGMSRKESERRESEAS